MVTDPIANFLNKIKNATNARKDLVVDPYSTMKKSIADMLLKRGFILSVTEEEEEGKRSLVVTTNSERGLLNVKRVSKPGQRIYVSWKEIRKIRNGLGLGIYSTSQGLLSDGEARKMKIGGEYICEIF